MTAVPTSLLVVIMVLLGGLLIFVIFAYWKFPLHLIYKSKIGYESMLDAVGDPLAVVSADYTVIRANKAYISLVAGSFSESIGKKCYELLRGRSSVCPDCRLLEAVTSHESRIVESSPHPSGMGAIRLSFMPFESDGSAASRVIEHIRDITVLERLKGDLEEKNRNYAGAMRTLRQAQRNIREDLRLARRIQEGLLPKTPPDIPGMRFALRYQPALDVGGDLYDFIQFTNERLGVFIGDASGHGLAASLVGAIAKMSLYNNSRSEMPPHEVLSAINRDLYKNIQTNHYLTCFLGLFDLANKTFTYSRAGHPIPLLIGRDGAVRHLTSSGTFAGVIENTGFEEISCRFQAGDRIYLFTDGIYEIQNAEGNYLGYDFFVSAIVELNGLPIDEIVPALAKRFSPYTFADDYTLVIIEILDDGARSSTISTSKEPTP
jgi:serine phosphatase RsbU (regulator of sigma subunit)